MKAKLAVLIASLIAGAAVPLSAHHSFSAEFDHQKPAKLVGILTKMEWINPHGWIHVEVKGPDGQVVSWAVETGAPNSLLRRGLRITDFPIGVEIQVSGFLAKSGKPVINGRTITFPDGRDFFFGSSGNGAPDDPAER